MVEIQSDFEEIKKCIYGKCNHELREHKHGSCYHVTQEDLTQVNTIKKYCPCGKDEGKNLRLFQDLGFMEPTSEDQMVTKTCVSCKKAFLMNIHAEKCLFCRTL